MAYSFHLKQARKKLKISLREASAALDLSPSTLYRYEEGIISHIPPKKLMTILRFYRISPDKIRREWIVMNALERLSMYEESQRRIDADFLYERYSSLDERGRRNVLRLLLYESGLMTAKRGQDTPRGL